MKKLLQMLLLTAVMAIPAMSQELVFYSGTINGVEGVRYDTEANLAQAIAEDIALNSAACTSATFDPRKVTVSYSATSGWSVTQVQGTVQCTPNLFFPGATGSISGNRDGKLPGVLLSAMEGTEPKSANTSSE